jgi:hypothetical protein
MACSAEHSTTAENNVPDAAVSKVSGELARIGLHVESSKRTHCLLEQVYAPPEGESEADALEFWGKLQDRERIWCQAFTAAEVERAAIFAYVRQTSEIPPSIFAFSYFEPSPLDSHERNSRVGFEEFTLGPFRAEPECARIESLLRAAAIPTRRCQPWPHTP